MSREQLDDRPVAGSLASQRASALEADPMELWDALAHLYESTDDQEAAIDPLEGRAEVWTAPGGSNAQRDLIPIMRRTLSTTTPKEPT